MIFKEEYYPIELQTGRFKPIEYEIDNNGCWICTSHALRKGYPKVKRWKKEISVHRYILQIASDSYHPNMDACHTCDNRLCINPDHLWWGTRGENLRDMYVKHRDGVTGEKHPNSKLKVVDVLAIRADERSQSKIAVDYGIAQSHVSRIKRRAAWRQ